MADQPHFVYIVQCRDGTYYVGSARDVEKRIAAHNSHLGARHTGIRAPVKLVHVEEHPNLVSARQRELQIKRWSRAKKEALILGDVDLLRQLSRRRIPSPLVTSGNPIRAHHPTRDC
jgi:putative endonuclease